MIKKLMEKYDAIVDQINDTWYQISLIYEEDEEPDKDALNYHRNIQMTLYAYLIYLRLSLLRLHQKAFAEDFQEDLEELILFVNLIRLESELTEESMGIIMDLILMPDPYLERDLLALLTPQQRSLVPQNREFRNDSFILPLNMLHSFCNLGMQEQAITTATRMLSLSEERNGDDDRMHRCVVSHVLGFTVDSDTPFTLQVCEDQEFYFEEAADQFTVDFYWFYGVTLGRVRRSNESKEMLRKCYEVSMQAVGPRSWNGTRANVYLHVLNVCPSNIDKTTEFLLDFLQKVDDRFYHGCSDESADLFAAQTRLDLLNFHMDNQTIRTVYPELLRYCEFCEENEEALQSKYFTMRRAYNMLSEYYIELNDFLQAEKYMLLCANTMPPEGVEAVPSEDLLYSNLLMVYISHKNWKKISELIDYLSDQLDNSDLDDYRYYRFMTQILTSCSILNVPMEDLLEDVYNELYDYYEDLLNGDTSEMDSAGSNIGIYILVCILILNDHVIPTEEDKTCYRALIQHIRDHPDTFLLSNNRMMLLYMELARMAHFSRQPEAITYIDTALSYNTSLVSFGDASILVRRIAATIYCTMGYPQKAVEITRESLNEMTRSWQNLVSYLDDHKICSILTTIQDNYYLFYTIFRTVETKEVLYDQLLRNKYLAGLAGRERNRILRLSPVDETLKKEIFRLQDQLAAAELDDARTDEDTAEEIRLQIQSLETEFASQFPEHVSFTEISLSRLTQVLQEDEAIIEYFFAPPNDSLGNPWVTFDDFQLDIFLLRKKNGKAELSLFQLPNAIGIRQQAKTFLDILQDPNGKLRGGEKASIRASLYNQLLAPAMPFLEGVQTLYLAPDMELTNLPFEILYADGSGLLQERFRVCRLTCGRDLLFSGNTGSRGASGFVLGDPDYEAEKGEISDSFTRSASELSSVASLPCSYEEARRVAKRLGVTPCTGSAATKFALQSALPCRVIHLATHGSFDESLSRDSLYFSHLIFAGYNKWVANQTESAHCGNGILTADEISRMDLRSTELVVLSSCMSGMGDFTLGTSQGLVAALSAAGARWVISHIWKANDFTTPILMDAFYKAYKTYGMEVLDALQYAKHHLRTITVGQLREEGWLDPIRTSRLSPLQQRQLDVLRNASDKKKPYSDETYWGGFVCHKCKN